MRANLLPPTIPNRDELRRIRESLGLSQKEFAAAIGFKNPAGEDTVRRWEKDETAKPSPTAWQAIRYLVMVLDLYDDAPDGPEKAKIASLLPECLR